eukprot:scaffold110020_cov48-Phaeocystis_antarctica.AAC.1
MYRSRGEQPSSCVWFAWGSVGAYTLRDSLHSFVGCVRACHSRERSLRSTFRRSTSLRQVLQTSWHAMRRIIRRGWRVRRSHRDRMGSSEAQLLL